MAEYSWSIYVLIDPRSDEILYVGRTKNPKMRLAAHISDALKAGRKNTRKNNRLRKIIDAGQVPVLQVVEKGTGDSAAAECRWIAALRSRGIDLLNSTDGGEGVTGLVRAPRTAEHCANLSAALRRAMTPERRARLSAAIAGRPRAVEHCKNLAKALTGNKLSPETRARISAAMRANKNAVSAAPRSAEHRKRISETLSAALTGRTLSAAHRAAIKASWNRRKKVLD